MISKRMFRILKGFDELGKKGIFVKMDNNNYSKYEVLNLLNWSGEHDDSQYPFAENLKHENPDLIDYITFEMNSECVILNEKAHQDIDEYSREKRNEFRANSSIIISVVALIVSVAAICVSIVVKNT